MIAWLNTSRKAAAAASPAGAVFWRGTGFWVSVVVAVGLLVVMPQAQVLAEVKDRSQIKIPLNRVPSPKKIEEYRGRWRAKQKLLKQKEKRRASVKADLAAIDKERERLSARLLETASSIQDSERRLTQIEARQKKLEAQETILRGALAQRHDVIAKLLAAMQRMGRNPPPVMITRRKDALKMVRSAMLLASTFPELRDKALDLAGRLTELQRVVDESAKEANKLKAETKRLADTQKRLASLMEEKRQSIRRRKTELVSLRREAAVIKKSVKGLGDLIARLDKAVAEHTRLGAYNKKQKRGRSSQRSFAAVGGSKGRNSQSRPQKTATLMLPVRPPVDNPLPSSSNRSGSDAVVIAPRSNIGFVSPGRLQPAFPFSRAKGRLPRPAHGRQLVSYGEKTQYGARSKGIVIATRHGAQITSPSDGWVVYAGEFRSYGQLLIINAGQEYHILLAGMSRIDVEPGQFVLAGEPVGTMSGSVRKSKNTSRESAPVLYVEFRKNGRPINPKPWWAEKLAKVQG